MPPERLNWTKSLEKAILKRIAHGESVRRICTDLEMPSRSMVYEHLIESKAFADQYARAKEAGADAMGDEILDIADDTSDDTKTITRGDNSYEVENAEYINRCRLQVDTRKWLMSKLAPKKYGDKIQQEVSGTDGGPIQAEITVKFV